MKSQTQTDTQTQTEPEPQPQPETQNQTEPQTDAQDQTEPEPEPIQHYLERRVGIDGDQLDVIARLVRDATDDAYVVYESGTQFCYAGGVLAAVSLDRSGARMHGPQERLVPWDGAPLKQVEKLLREVPVADWRAYGWAAFELAYVKEGDLGDLGETAAQPLLHLVIPRTEVRLERDEAWVRAADEESLEAVLATLADGRDGPRCEPRPIDVRKRGAEEYQQAVALAIDEINERKLQKVILSRTVQLEEEIDLLDTYVSGRRGNDPARSFLIRLGGVESAGFCPETVVQVAEDGRTVIQPLAGTRALTPDPVQNSLLRAELLSDPKEIYEHAISVKTACDDLRLVCSPESLTVEEFMAVRERGTVQHLASRVAGKLTQGSGAWDAFSAAFPAVTASGVPKGAAYASIRAHEKRFRGLYSGAVLTVDQDGAMDAGLVLRAVYRQNGATWLQAGAGIVRESRPVREFEETCEKLDSVARFLVSTRMSV